MVCCSDSRGIPCRLGDCRIRFQASIARHVLDHDMLSCRIFHYSSVSLAVEGIPRFGPIHSSSVLSDFGAFVDWRQRFFLPGLCRGLAQWFRGFPHIEFFAHAVNMARSLSCVPGGAGGPPYHGRFATKILHPASICVSSVPICGSKNPLKHLFS
jgi:hypothetical protein